ncbi:hypothetical protein GS438_21410 [Rhodococcus hoagii]|nr:hypothetical protein [Prescottella equi]
MTQIVAPTHPFDVAVELSPSWAHPASSWATPPAYANMVGPSVASTAATLPLRRAVLQHPNVWATRCPSR